MVSEDSKMTEKEKEFCESFKSKLIQFFNEVDSKNLIYKPSLEQFNNFMKILEESNKYTSVYNFVNSHFEKEKIEPFINLMNSQGAKREDIGYLYFTLLIFEFNRFTELFKLGLLMFINIHRLKLNKKAPLGKLKESLEKKF